MTDDYDPDYGDGPQEPRREVEPEIPALSHIDAYVCGLCLTSVGAECHVPGCAFWMHDVPTEDTADALRSAIEATS